MSMSGILAGVLAVFCKQGSALFTAGIHPTVTTQYREARTRMRPKSLYFDRWWYRQ